MTIASGTAYTWDNAMIEGRRRLRLLEDALDPTTFRRLGELGVTTGWHCLELGAGGGSVAERLCELVGASGRVCAVDLDARFLRGLPHQHLEVREENIITSGLAAGSFDFVHSRWTLLHIPERDAIVRKLVELLKPGGVILLEEADILPVRHADTTGFSSLTDRIDPIIASRGSSTAWARSLPLMLDSLGIVDVGGTAEYPYFRGGSGLAEFWRMSWGRVRDGVASSGADVVQWDAELAELDDASKIFMAPMTVGAWGRKPR